jgi:hypothetical protein
VYSICKVCTPRKLRVKPAFFEKTSFFHVFSRFFALGIKQNRYSMPYIGYEVFTYFGRQCLVLCLHGGEQPGADFLVGTGKGAVYAGAERGAGWVSMGPG